MPLRHTKKEAFCHTQLFSLKFTTHIKALSLSFSLYFSPGKLFSLSLSRAKYIRNFCSPYNAKKRFLVKIHWKIFLLFPTHIISIASSEQNGCFVAPLQVSLVFLWKKKRQESEIFSPLFPIFKGVRKREKKVYRVVELKAKIAIRKSEKAKNCKK